MPTDPVPIRENIIDPRTNKVSRVWERFFNLLRDYAVNTETDSVKGPASSTDHNVAVFSGTTGKLVEDSGITKTNVEDAVTKKHSQNTDTGTTGSTFVVNSGAGTTLTLTGGANTFSIADGTASLDLAAGAVVNVDDDVTVAAELHVEAATHVNQDLTTDAQPTFAQLAGLGVPDAAGEAIRQTTLITESSLGSAVDLKHLGTREGLNVTIKDGTNLYISGGCIEINGIIYSAASQLTVALGTIVASTVYFLYVNAPASGTTLTATEFTVSTTVSLFSDSLGAEYKTGDTTKRYIARYYEE